MTLIIRDEIADYLSKSSIIDYDNDLIFTKANELKVDSMNEYDLIKNSYEFVRDKIDHSADIKGTIVTCKASEVLTEGEGICYAKSHLLAALLRVNGIPCGFAYQRLILDDIFKPYLILHGLNAVYMESIDKWIRIDARGNKEGVNSQFMVEEEQLAFKVREELGEEDILVVYSNPDKVVVDCLSSYESVDLLFDNLPKKLSNR